MSNKTIDYDLIRQLAAILDETDLTEIEVEQDKLRVRVARTPAVQSFAPAAMAAPAPAAPAAAAALSPTGGIPDPATHPGAVTSPMVGTCYLAAEPGARSFVEVGDTVRQGQTVLIVEAMKHMNQIAAPRAGKVTAIFVDNGQPVEFGEPLLIIE
ncbi:acetyl-CoA carboxylase biotin carboxyl carrier protein [Chthonobacter rhizosphaerae]|uniref:acetyl-CoA carboxylase biotin carboxyl carrier protein n=1 Tax=Chthonobacter rhizosphaerae TaxID=2735553 RepID=UPI0015EE4964|nr:acetyl-CoA carboxylase biotin carboxyl carrier protein [Chthonobacter rhizosphaerae]